MPERDDPGNEAASQPPDRGLENWGPDPASRAPNSTAEWKSARHETLLERGWKRRFVAAPPRLDEMVEMYESLGLEVRVEPPATDEATGPCGDCALARAAFGVVYTKGGST